MKPALLQRVSNTSDGGGGGGGGGGSEGTEGGEGTGSGGGGGGNGAGARSRFDMSISEMERYEVSDIRRFLRWANYNMTYALQVKAVIVPPTSLFVNIRKRSRVFHFHSYQSSSPYLFSDRTGMVANVIVTWLNGLTLFWMNYLQD